MRLPVVLLLIGCLLAGAARAGEFPTSATRAIAAAERETFVLDSHGNMHGPLRELMRLRFAATAAIIDAVERLDKNPKKTELRDALLRILGFTKDPASIPWLEKRLAGPHAATIHEAYLIGWQRHSVPPGSWPWLTGRDAWAAFWRRAFQSEADVGRRLEILQLLATFENEAVTDLLRKLAEETSEPKERLVTAAYLDAHGRPVADVAIRAAVQSLTVSQEDFIFLTDLAYEFHHPAFIDYLIEHAEMSPWYSPGSKPALLALERIAYRQDIRDQAGWRSWHKTHRDQPREKWRNEALNEFRELLRSDIVAAASWFDRNVYVLAEIELLDFMQEEVEPHESLRSTLAGWINLAWTPRSHERLRPLGERLAARPDRLDEHALQLLRERGYVPGQPLPRWADEVSRVNSRL